jgi:DNA polymerase-3 subunit beta
LNLTIERAPALEALSRLVGVIERKQTIPILGNVALQAEGSTITVRGTDLEMEVIETFDAQVRAEGQITVPADKLHDIVRNADAGAQVVLSFDGQADPRMKVQSGRSRYSLPALSAASFPQFSVEGLDAGFNLPAAQLAEMIARVYWSSTPSDRDSIKGVVRLATYEGQLHAVAANTSGVALVRTDAPEGARIAASLPSKVSQHLMRWLNAAAGDAHVATSAGLIQVTHGGSTYTAKLFDMPTYFPYEKNIHEGHEHFAKVARDELTQALKRVMIMLDQRVKTVRLVFAEGQVTVAARNDHSGDGADEIGAEYDGPEALVTLDGPTLISALAALKGDIVEFGFAPTLEAGKYKSGLVIIRAPSDPGFITNIMQPRA